MAFGGATSLGANGSTGNNQSSLALTLSLAGIAVGELAVIVVVDDNIGAGADADGNEVTSVVDNAAGGSNTWIKAAGWTNNMAGAQAGAHVSIWYTLAERAVAITSGTITASFQNSTLSDATAITGYKFTIGAGSTVAVEATNQSSVTAGQPGALDATTANIECLRVRGIAGEVGTAISLTKTAAFATAWANGNSATSGTILEMCARAEHAISTGTGLSSNPTWSTVNCDIANVYVAFREVFAAQDIHPTTKPTSVTYPKPTVALGPAPQDIHPTLVSVTTYPKPTVTPGTYTVTPTTFVNVSTFGTLFSQLPYAGGQVTKLGPGGYSIPFGVTPSVVRVINEVVRLIESKLTASVFVRMVNETINIADNILRVIFSDLVKMVNETVRSIEAFVTTRVMNRMVNETEQVVEDDPITAQLLVRPFGETVNITEDAPDEVMTLSRMVSETLHINEAVQYAKLAIFMVNEAVNIAENKLYSLSIDIIKIINETVDVVETRLRLLAAEVTRVVNETVHVVEGKVTQQFIIRMINEVERVNEALLAVRARLQVINETLRINEAILRVRSLVRMRDEAENVNEGLVTFRPLIRMINETVRVVETILDVVFHDLFKWINEQVRISENTSAFKTVIRTISETVRVIESSSPYRGLVKLLDDTVSFVEDFSISRELVLAYDEAINWVESLAISRRIARHRAEVISPTAESQSITRGRTFFWDEPVTLVELPSETAIAIIQMVSEFLNLNELLDRISKIPSLVCAAIRLYAVLAGGAQLAPAVMGATAIGPAVGGDTDINPALEGRVEIEECD